MVRPIAPEQCLRKKSEPRENERRMTTHRLRRAETTPALSKNNNDPPIRVLTTRQPCPILPVHIAWHTTKPMQQARNGMRAISAKSLATESIRHGFSRNHPRSNRDEQMQKMDRTPARNGGAQEQKWRWSEQQLQPTRAFPSRSRA